MKQLSIFLLLLLSPLLTGFDYSKHSIPIEEIEDGGPSKDDIPALTNPPFVSTQEANAFIKEDDRVLGLFINGEAKAYPINIMTWHEIVNDVVGGQKVLISYCPLCGTGMAFNPKIAGKDYSFGVSGLLYKSDVLMYDHQTESLWSQIKQEAVTGPMTGKKLELLIMDHTTWKGWKTKHPKTKALSMNTGYTRNYFRDPYSAYEGSDQLMFSVGKQDERYGPKQWVLGVRVNGKTKAYPFLELKKGARTLNDKLGNEAIKIVYEPEFRSTHVYDSQGKEIPTVVAYWFAWSAFHPKTEIFIIKKDEPPLPKDE